MDIDFKDRKLRRLCEQSAIAQQKLGKPCARRLQARLADLAAACSVTELPAGRPHPLKGDWAGCFALDLANGKRLVFEPDHEPVPEDQDGAIDWSVVTRIRIVYIGDYHD